MKTAAMIFGLALVGSQALAQEQTRIYGRTAGASARPPLMARIEGCLRQGRRRPQGQLPDLPNTDSYGSGRGDGEAARCHARRGEDRAARAREILQFAKRRTEGAL